MKLVLILMIKNEEKILLRCLKALATVVDAYCILDTGSTDVSKEIATTFLKENIGCITEEPWQNFGHNRTVSFQNAQDFCKSQGWDLQDTYGLLLDADMVFVNGTLKQEKLTAVGYKALQKNGHLEYMNARLLRMDYDWKCLGVTHEYWDGPTEPLNTSACYIDDKNDGGCKSDKFTRDKKLLEDGIAKDPTNVRYAFYLAQTYSCLNMIDESIAYYKKRIDLGGWYEEIWYSHYSIADLYKRKGDLIEFEAWMLRAYAFRKERAESLYKLAQWFRLSGEHYKSYHYIQLGRKIPYPEHDSLFIEANIYRGLFDYEASIIEYYIHENKTVGLRSSFKYLLTGGEFKDNVLQNLHFYTKPIFKKAEQLKLEDVFPSYHPSAISVDIYPMANVRFVNYRIEEGNYITDADAPVDTQNAYMNLETGSSYTKMVAPPIDTTSRVRGLEDVRLYRKDGIVRCFATSVYEYDSKRVCQVDATYDTESGTYSDMKILASPFQRTCEKNWIPIPGTDMVIYDWFPMRIGSINDTSLRIHITHETPPLFQMFRGSAPPIVAGKGWIALVHFVEYSKPRKYYNCLVELDSAYKPVKVSLPFIFYSPSIEYCISFQKIEGEYVFFVSQMDAKPSKVTIQSSAFEWFNV